MPFTVDVHHHMLPDFFFAATNEADRPVGGIQPPPWSKDAALSFLDDAGIDVVDPLERIARTYPACVWLNPIPEGQWAYTQSISMMRQLLGNRMYPLTLEGLDRAMRELVR